MNLQIETSQDKIDIPLDAELGYCLNVSGGIDSGTLLYCICKTMTDHNKFKPVYAITTQNKNDKACGYHAQLVIDFVRRKFPKVKIEHILVSSFLGGEHKASKSNRIVYDLYQDKKIDIYFDGVTRNPIDDSFKFTAPDKRYVERISVRDKPLKREITYFYGLKRIRPWSNLDKRGIREITDKYNISIKLLLLTKSCTDGKMYECGTCWWCSERKWAYGDLYIGFRHWK